MQQQFHVQRLLFQVPVLYQEAGPFSSWRQYVSGQVLSFPSMYLASAVNHVLCWVPEKQIPTH